MAAPKLSFDEISVPEFPHRIELELVSECNLECVYCPRHYVDDLTDFIDFELFKRLIDEMEPYPDTVLVLHRRGESLLHPQFVECCEYVRGKFREVQIATNVTPLTDKKCQAIIDCLDFVSFSIDVPSRFNETRLPAKYEPVEKKILRFLELNQGKIRTQVSMVQTPETPLDELSVFQENWQAKVDRVRIYQEHSTDGNFGSIAGGRFPRFPCQMPVYEMLIYCDGKTGRCNHDWDGPPMGNVNTHSIKEIWNNDAYADLRKQHQQLKITDPVCAKCDSWYPEVGQQGTGQVIEQTASGS